MQFSFVLVSMSESDLAIMIPALFRISLFPVISHPLGTFLCAFLFGSISCTHNSAASLYFVKTKNSVDRGLPLVLDSRYFSTIFAAQIQPFLGLADLPP
jgi:hypothetical protein